MNQPGVTDLYARARAALLDALEALEAHRDAVVLVGAQAIYLYTGHTDVPIATETKDTDLAIDPDRLATDPLIEQAMSKAGFLRNLDSGQPGEWVNETGIPVDLLVPETMVPDVGRRGARIPPHSKVATRKVLGLEAALVDNRRIDVRALQPDDDRLYQANVAGPSALCVAKLHKLGERRERPDRLLDKDAHDLYRLMRKIETGELAEGFGLLLDDRRSSGVTTAAIGYLETLFTGAEAQGATMAGAAEVGVGDPTAVTAAATLFANDLLDALANTGP